MKKLSQDTKDYWVQSSIPHLNNPSTLEFMREAVIPYHPVVISGLQSISHWKAWKSWDWNYLLSKCGDKNCMINFTPNGFADCVLVEHPEKEGETARGNGDEESPQEFFYYPLELEVSMKLFLDMLLNPKEDDAIPYLSQQNNNFVTTFPELQDDIELSLKLGEEAFNSQPEAVNIWIGDQRSTSSLHKDHFENLYVVITGEKIFTLFPPTDIAFLGESNYQTRTYQLQRENTSTEPEHLYRPKKADLVSTSQGCPSSELPWIGVDPESVNAFDRLPSLQYTSPIHVRVRAGEILFIPSLWYHRVTQSCPTIAINYWYEQSFNFRYVFYLSARRLGSTGVSLGDDDEGGEGEERIEN